MKTRSKRVTAALVLMMMITTLMMPTGAFAAKPDPNADHTFTESVDNDGSFRDPITVDMGTTRQLIFSYTHYYDNWFEVDGQLPEGLSLDITGDSSGDAVVKLVGNAINHTSGENDSLSIKITFRYKYTTLLGASRSGSLVKTFNIIFRDNEPDPEPEPEPEPVEPGTGQPEKLTRDKIRVLEIYPNDIQREKEEVKNMDVISQLGKDSRFEVTTISINRLISLKDEINGKYDIVYFNGGVYTRNYAYEHSYGSDITRLCAGKLKEFIESGQLCIFHQKIFENSSDSKRQTILKEEFSSYINKPNYKNVILVNDSNKGNVIDNLYNLYEDTKQGLNPRPILEIVNCPATYSADNTDPVSNRLTFSFKVYDPNTDENASLRVALYLDRNNDSLYNENEIVFYQADENGNMYTMEVKNGRSGTITYDMPQGLTGVYFWKLVVMDARNAKNEFESVFRLKGNPITVRLLQIMPNVKRAENEESDGNGNLSLKKKFGQSVDGHTYRYKEGEYEIIIDEITVQDFNRLAENGEITLNGIYDMVVIGFNDNYTEANNMDSRNYSGALGWKAVELLDDFIKTKQSVMFTHDTIHFTYNRELTEQFAAAAGQVFKTDSQGRFAGIWTAGLAGSGLSVFTNDVVSANRKQAQDSIKEYDPNNHYQTVNTWPDNATTVKPVNSSAVTMYPFLLEGGDYDRPGDMKVASTHYQWYKLNLEDPEVVPLFNLYKDGKEKFNDDAMNNYYTYTKGTITYSGTGHKLNDTERYPVFETKLFVNTAIKAYSIANHAPEVVILDPKDNEKVSAADGELKLRFRAYDFDFGNDYLLYEVFIDAENGGTDEDFVSLTGDEKILTRNGQQVELIIPEDKMPGAGKFRLKVYAEDEHKAGAFEIITLERVDSPMITPEIVICDKYGNPIERALVGQEVKAKMKFAVSGKTAEETVCEPVFDLKGAYYIETEREYLTGESLGEVVFSVEDPVPQEIEAEDYNFTINPASPGDTELTMTVTVRGIEELFEEKSSADSVRVRNGQVEFHVKDMYGNPVAGAPITDKATGSILGYTDSSGYLHVDGLAGARSFKPGTVAGFTFDEDNSESMKISRLSGSGWVEENLIDLTYENNIWKVEFFLDFSHGLTIDYYRLNTGRNRITFIGSALGSSGTIYEMRNHQLTAAELVAVVKVDPLASGDVREIEFTIETTKKTGEVETEVTDARLKAVIVDADDSAVADVVEAALSVECTQLKSSNEISEGSYAGKTCFLLIKVPKTDGQIVRIKEVRLKTVTPSGTEIERDPDFGEGVKFVPTAPPMLR